MTTEFRKSYSSGTPSATWPSPAKEGFGSISSAGMLIYLHRDIDVPEIMTLCRI